MTQDVGLNSSQPGTHFAKVNGNFSSLTATRFSDKLTGRNNTNLYGGAGNDEFFAGPMPRALASLAELMLIRSQIRYHWDPLFLMVAPTPILYPISQVG